MITWALQIQALICEQGQPLLQYEFYRGHVTKPEILRLLVDINWLWIIVCLVMIFVILSLCLFTGEYTMTEFPFWGNHSFKAWGDRTAPLFKIKSAKIMSFSKLTVFTLKPLGKQKQTELGGIWCLEEYLTTCKLPWISVSFNHTSACWRL